LQPCEECQADSSRIYLSMPGVTRASYIDSTKTARARDMQDLKTAAKFEVERANLPHSERGEINSAIKKLKGVKK